MNSLLFDEYYSVKKSTLFNEKLLKLLSSMAHFLWPILIIKCHLNILVTLVTNLIMFHPAGRCSYTEIAFSDLTITNATEGATITYGCIRGYRDIRYNRRVSIVCGDDLTWQGDWLECTGRCVCRCGRCM